MTNVKMKTLVDSLHLTAVGPDSLAEGATFDINETEAKQLEDRGLAKRAGEAKKEPAPANKADAPSNNKTISADSVKAPAARKGK